jgi:hypothetical protein
VSPIDLFEISPDFICSEKTDLLDAYLQATTELSETIRTLITSMHSQNDYTAAYQRVEQLKVVHREAHEKLMQHIAVHGC